MILIWQYFAKVYDKDNTPLILRNILFKHQCFIHCQTLHFSSFLLFMVYDQDLYCNKLLC